MLSIVSDWEEKCHQAALTNKQQLDDDICEIYNKRVERSNACLYHEWVR